MGGFERYDHVTKELTVFGQVETKVHSRRSLYTIYKSSGGNLKSSYLGDFSFAMPGEIAKYMVARNVKRTLESESLKFLQRQMNYQRKHAKLG